MRQNPVRGTEEILGEVPEVTVRYGIPPLIKADADLYDMVHSFEESLRGVAMAAEQGSYRDFKALGSGYISFPPGSPESFCLGASFAYRQNPEAPVPVVVPEKDGVVQDVGRIVSHMALRTDRGDINKVRFNDPEDAGDAGFAGFMAFTVEWTQAVQRA